MDVQKLDSLIEKLIIKGDVSGNEALFVRMMMYMYHHAEYNDLKLRKDDEIHYYIASQMYKNLFLSLDDWYRAVYKAVRQGKTGNFIFSLDNAVLDDVFPDPVRESVRESLKLLPDRKIVNSSKLLDLINKRSAIYINKMAGKLKREGDITLDEADNLYLIFSYHNAMFLNGDHKFSDEYKHSVCGWYNCVYDKVVEQKQSGNFLHSLFNDDSTIKAFGSFFVSRFKDIFSSLPSAPYDRVFYPPNFPALDKPIWGFINRSGYAPYLEEKRYGAIERMIKENNLVVIPDIPLSSNVPYPTCLTWYEGLNDNRYKGPFIDHKNQKCYSSLVKMQYLRDCGISPVFGLHKETKSLNEKYFFVFREKDVDKAKQIFDIPNEIIEQKIPPIPLSTIGNPPEQYYRTCDIEEAFEQSVEIFKNMVELKNNEDKKDPDDGQGNWDIGR